MGIDSDELSERETRVDRVLAEYLLAVESGEAPDRHQLLACHPDLAEDLEKFLADRDRMEQWTKPMRGQAAQQSSTAPRTCPYCRGILEPGEGGAFCPGCGSGFRFEDALAVRLPGNGVLGRFQLLEMVGRGAFGAVYKALDPDLDRVVAVKVPREGTLDGTEALDRFMREARHAAGLRHPNIVPVYDAGQANGVPYLVSEFVKGPTLAELLRDEHRPTPDRAAEMLAQVADALHHAHEQGVIHRDVKPSNILLGADGSPRLMDFGLALRDTGEATLTKDGQALGTPAYMSPEQARGESHRVDCRSDIYSLGAVLYQMLTDHQPFAGNPEMIMHRVIHDEPWPPRSLNDRLPRDLETICLKALAKAPARRYATARALAEDLRRFRDGKPVLARPVGHLERLGRWGWRNPALASVLALAATLLISTTVVSISWGIHANWMTRSVQLALDESELRRAENRLDRGLMEAERGEVSLGLLWMSYSLATAPPESTDFGRVIRANLDGWQRQLFALTHCWSPQGEVLGFSPDGQSAWTANADKKLVQRWELALSRIAGPPLAHPRPVTALAVSPDGRLVATGCADKTVRLWDAITGEVQRTLLSKSTAVVLRFSPDGQAIVTANSETFDRAQSSVVQAWEVATGLPLGPELRQSGYVRGLGLSPDGQTLLTVHGMKKTVQRWELPTGRFLGEFLPHPGGLRAVAFSSDGRQILTGAEDRTARLWDAVTGRPLEVLHHRHVPTVVGFGPDGRTILTAGQGDVVRIWEGTTSLAPQQLLPHKWPVRALAVSPDGTRVVTGSDDRVAQVWQLAAGKFVPAMELRHPSPLAAIAFSPDGARLVTTTHQDNAAFLWDVASGRQLALLPHGWHVSMAVFSPDGRRVATGSYDGTARLWDSLTGQPATATAMSHVEDTVVVAFSPDSRVLVTAGRNGQACRWDVATGAFLEPPLRHGSGVRAVAYSPDGRMILTGGENGKATRWDATTGLALGPALEHAATVWTVAFSPDSRIVLTGSWDHTARLWDATTGKPLGPPLRHAGRIWAAAFSPDSRWVVTVSDDQTARLWDVDSGRLLGPPLQHGGPVFGVVIGPDNQWVATASHDNAARVWSALAPRESSVEQTVLWTQVITGTELDPGEGVQVLDAAVWQQRRQRLLELGGPSFR